jgi:hypothetical protein
MVENPPAPATVGEAITPNEDVAPKRKAAARVHSDDAVVRRTRPASSPPRCKSRVVDREQGRKREGVGVSTAAM